MGLGTLRLTVILAEPRIPFDSAQLMSARQCRGRAGVGGWREVLGHGEEVPPACCSCGTGDPSYVSQNCFDLLTSAACNFWLEGADSRVVPLPGPAARLESRLVVGGEERLELPTQRQHGSWGEATNRKSKIEGAPRPRVCCTRAVPQHMGLGPEAMTNRAGTYLGRLRFCRHRLIFAVPAKVPVSPKGLDTLPEGLGPV